MKFWSIVPTEYIDKKDFHTSDTQLVLFHKIENGNEYQKRCLNWKKQGGKIVLDDGYYELKKNPLREEIVNKAKLIQADIIIPFDIPWRHNFRFIIESGIKRIKELGYTGKIMCLVYAENESFSKDMEQFKTLNSIKDVDIIAIPYSFSSKFEKLRPIFLRMIDKEIKKGNLKINKPIHLFGAYSLKTLEKEKVFKWVDSVDSTMPIKLGLNKIKLPHKKDFPRPKNYFDINKLNEEQENTIKSNIKWLKENL